MHYKVIIQLFLVRIPAALPISDYRLKVLRYILISHLKCLEIWYCIEFVTSWLLNSAVYIWNKPVISLRTAWILMQLRNQLEKKSNVHRDSIIICQWYMWRKNKIARAINHFTLPYVTGKIIDGSNADVAVDQYHRYPVSDDLHNWSFSNNKFPHQMLIFQWFSMFIKYEWHVILISWN